MAFDGVTKEDTQPNRKQSDGNRLACFNAMFSQVGKQMMPKPIQRREVSHGIRSNG